MKSFSSARVLKFLLGAFLSIAGVSSLAQPAAASQPIPGRYIVVFRNHVADADSESDRKVRRLGGRRHHSFSHAIKGFSASLTETAAEALRNDPDVDFVEQDQTVAASTTTENSATWGLDRIDQADRPLDVQYHYNYDGTGVYAFVIDTGIRADHVEIAGRVASGFNSAQHSAGVIDPNDTSDCNGHGTHVSGTIGGTTYGVAKNVTLVPVRVLDCSGSGTNSGVIAGLDWMAASPLRPAVANMSLGGGFSSALNLAVKNAVAAGVTVAVAAGNDNPDACKESPSSEPSAITVGATTSTDVRASFSNFGKCVDIFAPGLGITSSWGTSATALNTISGTSMATPHVTGVAALAVQANPSASPLAVTAFLKNNATANRLAANSLGSGSPNLLVFSMAPGVPAEPPLDTVAVKSLAGKSQKVQGGNWKAQATITVRDVNTTKVVANATVSGTFAPGGPGTCLTNNKGQCTITSGLIAGTVPTSVFTVDGIAALGLNYDAGQNAAAQVTINRH